MTDTATTAPAPKPPSQLAAFRNTLEGGMRTEIAKALPKDIDPDRFIRTVMTAVQMNPELLNANRRSLFASCMRAAQDGLMPDGREAVLNIYSTKMKTPQGDQWVPTVQYLPMVRGLLKTIRNSGEIAHIDAAAVYQRDEFTFERGDDPKLVHKPYLGADEPGQIIAAYVVVRLTNGEIHREVMPRRDLDKVRAQSKSGTGANSPWVKWEDQMAIKSVIKRAEKLLPTSSDRLARLIAHDNEAMGFEGFNQRGADATELTQEASAPALTDQREAQAKSTLRPSRMAGIVAQAKAAQPVQDVTPAQQAAAGLPTDPPADDGPPWDGPEDGQQSLDA